MGYVNIERKKMVFNLEEIKQIIPHRYPFLMIDRIIEVNEDSCVALKNVTGNEGFFLGHFPAQPIMPGVLIAESMAQASAFIKYFLDIKEKSKEKNFGVYLLDINIRFSKAIIPGDTMLITVKKLKTLRGVLSKLEGNVLVDNKVMSKGNFSVAHSKISE